VGLGRAGSREKRAAGRLRSGDRRDVQTCEVTSNDELARTALRLREDMRYFDGRLASVKLAPRRSTHCSTDMRTTDPMGAGELVPVAS